MADSGYYEKRPRRGSIETLLKYLKSHKFVADAFMETEQTMIVRRPAKGDLRVHLTNLYIVGIADVHEILGEDPTINAIVTMSHWNGYTTDAKSLCSEQDVGLFKFGEF